MKTIIAGCRDVEGAEAHALVVHALDACGWRDEITEVIHGDARGIDTAAGDVCCAFWKVTAMPAQWSTHGRAAGPIRNLEMAKVADALIAIWDGESRGPKHMIETATSLGLKVYIHRFERPVVPLDQLKIVESFKAGGDVWYCSESFPDRWCQVRDGHEFDFENNKYVLGCPGGAS